MEEAHAPRGDLAELREAWMNEKSAPEILQCDPRPVSDGLAAASSRLRRFRTELVARLLALASSQARLRRLRHGASTRAHPVRAGANSPVAPQRLARHHNGEPVLVRHGAFSALRPLSALRRMDLNRVKFLLRAYLRTRLVKVGAGSPSTHASFPLSGSRWSAD